MAVFLNILVALAALGGLGALFGFSLGFFGPRGGSPDRIGDALPGLNCGVCGYAGCEAYAGALAKKKVDPGLCLPGGEKVEKTLAKILGVEVSYTEETMVQVHCRGGEGTAEYLFSYRGLDDCRALYMLFGGDKECKFSCLGQGSCIKVCPREAIFRDRGGLIRVDRERCDMCGRCLDVCPTGVLRRIPKAADFIVACNSTDKGPVTAAICSVGCTACRACEKRSPEGGFEVDNYLARINYRRRGDRNGAVMACDPKCIVPNGAPAAAEKNAKA